jgi:hypothetical protein
MSEPTSPAVRKITLGLLLSWIVGIGLVLVGATNIASTTGAGIVFLLAAVIALPPANKFLAEKFKISLSGFLKFILIIVLFGIGVGMVASGSNTEAPVPAEVATNSQAPEQAIAVTATKLMADYEANEVAADATYKGKLVEVTGTISDISKDLFDNPYIALGAGANTFFTVQCMFEKSDQAQLASLAKDTKITLQGRVSSKLGNVIVQECSIVQ